MSVLTFRPPEAIRTAKQISLALQTPEDPFHLGAHDMV